VPPYASHASKFASPPLDFDRVCGLLIDFYEGATSSIAAARVEDTVRKWFGRASPVADGADKDEAFFLAFADAVSLAMELATFQPTFTGSTAADRFARQHKPRDQTEAIVLDGFQRARFRLLQIESRQSADLIRTKDL
jgi:hypothetical protein